MATQFDPEQIARQEFGHAFRGYDPQQVRSFLEQLAAQVAAIQREHAELRRQLGEMNDDELAAHIDQTTAEISNLLHAARETAQGMHDRAVDEVEALRVSTTERIGTQLRRAEQEAYQLRKAAWDTSSKMLDDVRREAAAMKKQAEKDTLGIIGEAERTAHRKVAEARREAETRARTARLEAEKLLVESRARRDEMFDEAERTTDAAQERVRALERRRDELMGELEAIRASTLAASKEEAVAREDFGSTTVRLLPSDGGSEEPPAEESLASEPEEVDDVRVIRSADTRWADGSDTVRLIPAGGRKEPARRPDLDPDELVEELISDTAEQAVVDSPLTEPVPPAADPTPKAENAEAETAEAEIRDAPDSEHDGAADGEIENEVNDATPDGEEDAAPEPDEPVVSDEPVPPPRIPEPTAVPGDDLGTLFDLLREPGDQPARASGADVTVDTPVEDLVTPPPLDPIELRDASLLPVMNRALRAVKRALSEIQNQEMQRLKDDLDGFSADAEPLAALVVPELLILVRESRGAGFADAVRLAGRDSLDRSALGQPAALDDPFAADATASVMEAVESERSAGAGVREISAAVSKVYRVWRSDEAERRVRGLAHAAYQQGMEAAIAQVDATEIEVDLSPLGI